MANWIEEIRTRKDNPCRVALRNYLKKLDIDLSLPETDKVKELYRQMEHIGYGMTETKVAIEAETDS